MKASDTIQHQLPYLRRYARAVTGAAAQGDLAVEQMLETLLADLTGQITRVTLFRALDIALAGRSRNSPPARRALLLTAMEGFSQADGAAILGVPETELAGLLAQAESDLADTPASRICIIEDEPLIGASLSQIATSLGHTVTGVLSTHTSAVAHALSEKPDLILADIQLADGSLGTEAVAEIRRTLAVPAIFITAFPERLLTGRSGEPTFLIPKPFKPSHVKAVITQALFVRSGTRP
ncbi:response regulator [Hyphomonas sp.]|uniref:PhyR family response regulator anti-anti-sigma factor n=1 Tax=Hyphomonas sp. TaxID=87 RepID=UPI0025B830D2|nr:response regulator [Hyphomonas sp.]